MDESAKKFVELLADLSQTIVDSDDSVGELHDAVDLLGSSDTVAEVFPSVFRLFEKCPKADFGMPGPLVHLLEDSYPGGYEELLLESLAKKPVTHTVWMANRLLNSVDVIDPLRSRLRRALKDVIDHPLADDLVKEDAERFLARHGP